MDYPPPLRFFWFLGSVMGFLSIGKSGASAAPIIFGDATSIKIEIKTPPSEWGEVSTFSDAANNFYILVPANWNDDGGLPQTFEFDVSLTALTGYTLTVPRVSPAGTTISFHTQATAGLQNHLRAPAAAAGAPSFRVEKAEVPYSGNIYLLPVEFALMWETKNKANQIFNHTKKDDSSDEGFNEIEGDFTYCIPREKLYAVATEDGNFEVSLDLLIPNPHRENFLCAAYLREVKVDGSDTPFPAQPGNPANMSFAHTESSNVTSDFEIRAGYDADGDGKLGDGEAVRLVVYESLRTGDTEKVARYATVRGIGKNRYAEHAKEINSLIGALGQDTPSLIAEKARSFLAIFRDGDLTNVRDAMHPSETNKSIVIEALNEELPGGSSDYREWLTHNAGAGFSEQGVAAIREGALS